MTREGMSGQTPVTETWETPDGRGLVIFYDHRGIAEVTREAMTDLLISAGLKRGPNA